ncbi:MAG: hypothetical protein JNL74_09820 [Fibrobacteres bacterium]|nr:hypothetical protein [Fibrobacterota bacterium]
MKLSSLVMITIGALSLSSFGEVDKKPTENFTFNPIEIEGLIDNPAAIYILDGMADGTLLSLKIEKGKFTPVNIDRESLEETTTLIANHKIQQ